MLVPYKEVSPTLLDPSVFDIALIWLYLRVILIDRFKYSYYIS